MLKTLPAQSYESLKEVQIPIPGFEIPEFEEPLKSIVAGVLVRHSMSERSFILRNFPEISCDGGMRSAVISVQNLHYMRSSDEKFPGMDKVVFSFDLQKGSYATVIIPALLTEEVEERLPTHSTVSSGQTFS